MDKYFPEEAKKNFSSKGKDIILEIGIDIIKGVVLDVLSGKNLRDSTELLTRKRILTLNAATLKMLVKGSSQEKDYIKNLPEYATKKLTRGKLSKSEKWMMQWILGLTDKASQNVLRDDHSSNLEIYKQKYLEISSKAINEFASDYGNLSGEIEFGPTEKAQLNWNFLTQLMTIIGSQTLTIRGSDKSTFGKLFEKIILGSLISIFDFQMISPNNIANTNKVFWLSQRENKRESDATLLYEAGKGIRFDIGFIGRGNSEISLDKVSRFEREMEFGRQKWYMATIIIVDRIGKNSRIEELAMAINGHIVQMSGAFWPVEVAKILAKTVGYRDKILSIDHNEVEAYLKEKISKIPYEKLLDMPAFDNLEIPPQVWSDQS